MRWPAGWGPWLWGLLSLACLGAAPLFDVDEGAFSEATREMLRSGDWLHTTLNGVDRFDKPIGIYWLQALSVQWGGWHEWTLRLPSALSAWGWAWALWAFARPRWGDDVARWAGWMVPTSLGVMIIGRAATADALLNLLLTLAALDAWRWLEQLGAEHPARAPLRRAYGWMGLGLLVKGPVACLVPGAATVLWLLWHRPGDQARRQHLLRTVADPWGWALLLGLALPWYVYAWQRHGTAFIEGFFVRHNLARYATPLEQHGGGPFYYLLALPLLLWPWGMLWPRVLRRWRQVGAEPLPRFLWLWGGFVLVFFSLSGTKLPHYVLYGASPWWLLMAREMPNVSARWRQALALGAAAPGLLLCGAALVVVNGVGTPPALAALLAGASWSTEALAWLVACVVAWLVCVGVAGRADGPGVWMGTAASTVVGAALTLGLALPWWGQVWQGPVQRLGVAAQTWPGTVVQWDVHQPSFAVYRQAEAPRRAPLPGEMALTTFQKASTLPPAQWVLLQRDHHLVLLRWLGPTAVERSP